MRKTVFASIIQLLILLSSATALGQRDFHPDDSGLNKEQQKQFPQNLKYFIRAYPDVLFSPEYDEEKDDWKITVTATQSNGKTKTQELYWCESRFLPEEKLSEKENYRRLLYKYNRTVPDPERFTEEDIKKIKDFTSKENRTNGAIDPPFLYNVIFDCETRVSTESHIENIKFLTLSANVHEKIVPHLKKVHEKAMALPRDEEISLFFKTLNRTDGFNWRTVRDTQSRSFHSIGLAIDVLPRGYYQKIIYWAWQKQLRPDDWFMTPLSKRWMPPQRLIDIFWEEGFVWGGTWAVWDNMHFEYHPELIEYAKDFPEK